MTTTNDTTTGTAPWRFHIEHDWLQPPEHIRFGETHSVQQLADGRLILAHTVHAESPCRDAILLFDAAGSFLDSWGADFAGAAHGLEIITEADGTERILLTVQGRGLSKLTPEGEEIWRFGKPAIYQTLFGLRWNPSNCAVAPDGRIFLADGYGTGFVVVLDADGREIDCFGGPGFGEEHLWHPHGLCVDTRGSEPILLVADNLRPGLHALDLAGRHLWKEAAGLKDPRHIRVAGEHLIVPDLCGRVTILDAANQVCCHLGDSGRTIEELFPLRERPRQEWPQGSFVHPHDACLLADGDLLVAEWLPIGRVNRLRRIDQ